MRSSKPVYDNDCHVPALIKITQDVTFKARRSWRIFFLLYKIPFVIMKLGVHDYVTQIATCKNLLCMYFFYT